MPEDGVLFAVWRAELRQPLKNKNVRERSERHLLLAASSSWTETTKDMVALEEEMWLCLSSIYMQYIHAVYTCTNVALHEAPESEHGVMNRKKKISVIAFDENDGTHVAVLAVCGSIHKCMHAVKLKIWGPCVLDPAPQAISMCFMHLPHPCMSNSQASAF